MKGRPYKPYGLNDPICLERWGYEVLCKIALVTDYSLLGIYLDSHADASFSLNRLSLIPTLEETCQHILMLMRAAGKPLSHSFIEATLQRWLGTEGSVVTAAFKRLRKNTTITLFPFNVTGKKQTCHVYSLGDRKPSMEEESALQELFDLHYDVFDRYNKLHGQVAEGYCSNIVRELNEFTQPRKSLLGNFPPSYLERKKNPKQVMPVPALHRKLVKKLPSKKFQKPKKLLFDLIVAHRSIICKGKRLHVGFSFNNSRDMIYPGKRHVSELEEYLAAFKIPTILAAVSFSKTSITRLDQLGVQYVELGTRIFVKELPDGRLSEVQIRRLRGIIGPSLFMFVAVEYQIKGKPKRYRACRLPDPNGEYSYQVACHKELFRKAVEKVVEAAERFDRSDDHKLVLEWLLDHRSITLSLPSPKGGYENMLICSPFRQGGLALPLPYSQGCFANWSTLKR